MPPQPCVCSDGLHSPADEGPDVFPGDGCHGHGHGLRRGQPVRVVIAGGEVADVVDVAEEEGHGAELPQAAARRACAGRGPWLPPTAGLGADGEGRLAQTTDVLRTRGGGSEHARN